MKSPANNDNKASRRADVPIPPVRDYSPLLVRWFTWYAKRYLRRHFHLFRVSRSGLPPRHLSRPVVVYTNHSSWWDPLVALVMREAYYPEKRAFAPVDARALRQYQFFKRLGFFPVEQGSLRGAMQFLHTSEVLLKRPDSLLLVTPQGRFADVRERPAGFLPGLEHLARRVAAPTVFLPVAMEYVYREERLPEILVRFGRQTLVTPGSSDDKAEGGWTSHFEQTLQQTQDDLALEAIRRDPAEFASVLTGKAGVGGVYDWWRQGVAVLRGRQFKIQHGTK